MDKEMIEELEEKKKSNSQKKAILMLEGIIVLLLVVIIVLLVVPEIRKSESTVKESNTQQEDIPPKKDNSAQEGNTNKEEKVSEDVEKIITEKVKKISEYFSTFYPFNSVNEIPNQELLRFAERNIANAMNGFSSSDVDSYLKNYFGNNITIKHEDITCDTVAVGDKNHPYLFLYDGNGKYSYNKEHGGHGVCSISANLKPVSSVKKGDEIVASYRILYTVCCDVCGPVTEYYKKLPANSNNLALKIPYSDDGSARTATEEEMNAAYEKTPITQFTFEVDSDGNYALKSVSEK